MRSKKNGDRDHQPALTPFSRPDFTCQDPDAELKERLKNLLAFEEGKIVLPNGLHVAYRDSKGIFTIGYGFNLQAGAAPGILRLVTTKTVQQLIAKTAFLTEVEAQGLLLIAADVAIKGVRSILPDYDSLDLPRRVVFASMVYQFGSAGFGKFYRLIAAEKLRDWPSVVLSMRQSQWYRSDSPKRARRMADAVLAGTFPASATLPPDFTPGPAPVAPPASGGKRRSSWPFDN